MLPFIEEAATAIGAGVLVGTFLGASAGVLNSRSRKEVEGDSLKNGYYGALGALVLLIVERNV